MADAKVELDLVQERGEGNRIGRMAFDPLLQECSQCAALPITPQPCTDGSSRGGVGVLVQLANGGVESLELGLGLGGC